MWNPFETADFIKLKRTFSRKRPQELAAALDNLGVYGRALEMGANPVNVQIGNCLHPEGCDVYAVDQKSNNSKFKYKRKPVQLRLYFHPESETETLFLLRIGEKDTQDDDIKKCHEFVKSRRSQLDAARKKVREHGGDDG